MDHSVSQSAADSSEKADDADDDDSEFAEVDPTGRYGRYNEVLGKGAVKTVYRAFDKVDGIEVAWNQVTVHDILQGSHNLERLYSEVHLLKSLKHKNIIKFYNSWVDTKTENVNFITEIFTSGNLRQYRRKHKHVNMKAVKNWARQILRGLLYLHSHDPPIIHRDLKCDNIFVNGNYGEVKIGDLGLAAILQQAHAAHSVIGTPEFMAPELYEEEYDELVDIYSFGMCVLEMVTFEYPYSECTNAAQIYKKVTSGRKPAALEKVKDPQVHSFIGKCLAAASHRLPARELLMDPFLQSDSFLGCSEHLHSTRSIIREDDVEDLANSGGIPNKCLPLEGSSEKASNLLYSEESKNEGSISQEKEKFVVVSDAVAGEDKGRSRLLGLDIMTSLSTNLREENPQKSSFRVQGKRGENETIFLRLRIGDREGHFRNIHFPFDMDADSALCVASEMVAELDLSDQDVTTIAEMIDTEIITFMPDWKPGAAFEDFNNIGTEEEEEEEALHLEDLVETESPFPLLSEIAVVDATHSEEFAPDSNLHSSLQQTHSIEITSLGVASPCHGEATLHGRFEEYTYQSGGSDHSCRSELHLDIVNCLSDTVHVDGDVLYPETDRGSYSTVDTCDEHLDHPMNLLILRNEADMQTVQLQHVKNECGPSGGRHLNASDSQTQEALAFVGVEKSRSANPDEEEDEETVALELSLLAMRQEQELRELQSKHEKALQEIRNRKSCKGSSGGSPNGMQADSIEQNIIEEEIASLNSTAVPSASCEALSIRE